MSEHVIRRYRKKPVVVEAYQWWKNGDHPDDACPLVKNANGPDFQGEGKVVRYYRNPQVPGVMFCACGEAMHKHGWIDTLEGGHTVCPGDFIITGVHGERYPCKPDIFAETYEEVEN